MMAYTCMSAGNTDNFIFFTDKRYIVCDEGQESKTQTKENDFGMYTMSGTLGSATGMITLFCHFHHLHVLLPHE